MKGAIIMMENVPEIQTLQTAVKTLWVECQDHHFSN